ncbi:uncharacterized protein [Apostichopus japonicus]|uniref:uncharacterized protein isoform X2 n=1 Tax=Stichopus japonicus TaxID=307972 RepID=UPI003AB3E6A5
MADTPNAYHTPTTTMSVVPPSTMSPQNHPPPSPAERFVQALGHDYNAIPVSNHYPRDLGPRPVTTHSPFTLPLSLLPNSIRLQNFPGVPAGMMELRSPMGHQPTTFMPTHPNFQLPFQALSPTMVPMESPSPTPLSPGFMYNSVPGFSPQFHPASVGVSQRKVPEVKEKSGVGWLDAAQRILEASNGPLHIDEIRKRILDLDILRSNTRSSLESVLSKDLHRGSKRFRKVKGQVYRLVTPEELTAQVKRQIAMTSTNARNSSQSLVQEQRSRKQKHKRNYLYMRRVAKQLVFENGALADTLAQSEKKLSRAKTERRFLLNRLLSYMAMMKDMSLLEVKKTRKPEREVERRQEKDSKKRKERNKHRHKRNKKVKGNTNPVEMEPPRRKLQTLSMTKHYMLPIPLNSTNGEPIFPIVLSNLRVHNLGLVKFDRPRYHDKSHIYTLGFSSERLYAHYQDPSKSMWYICKILDGGPTPVFQISGEGEEAQSFRGENINICHQKLMEAVNRASGKRMVDDTRGSGAEFFGISNPTICNLIQNLANAEKCPGYKMMQFETCPEKDRKKLRLWCAEDPRIDYDALQRSQEGYTKRIDLGGSSSRLTMTDSERLRFILNRTSTSHLQSSTVASSVSSVDDLSTQDGDADTTDHIDVT